MKKLIYLMMLIGGSAFADSHNIMKIKVSKAIDHSSSMSCIYTGEEEYLKDNKSYLRTVYFISKGTCSSNNIILCEPKSFKINTIKLFEGKGDCK